MASTERDLADRRLFEQLQASGLVEVIETATGTRFPTLDTSESRVSGGKEGHLGAPKYSPHPGLAISWLTEIPIQNPSRPMTPLDQLWVQVSMRFPNAGVSLGTHHADLIYSDGAFVGWGEQIAVAELTGNREEDATRVDEMLAEVLTKPRFSSNSGYQR